MGGSSFGGGRSSGSFSRGSSFGGGSFGAASSFGGASRSVGASAFGGAGSSFGSSAFGAPSRSTTHIHVGSPLGFFTPSYGVVSTYSASSALFNLMLLGFVAFVAVQVAQSFFNNGSYGGAASTGAAPVTLVRLQVGCLGMAKQLKRDLDSLAERADTSSQAGLHFMLQEAVLSLLRNPDYCVYADSGSKALSDPDQAEERFQALSLRERSKFKEETLVNVGGKKRSKAMTQGSDGVNELTVVTILVAAEASLQLPKVRTSADLREALSILGGLGAGQVLAVELMWTPQADNDYYTRDELINDYPNMVPL